MKSVIITCLCLWALPSWSQELFTLTEPASNKASGSITVRMDHSLMDDKYSSKINYHLIPQVMVGLSKKVMIAGEMFFSNRNKDFEKEGGSIYFKYRFLSKDVLQKHFRMAVFARASYNNSDIHQEELSMYGHNTGFEIGVVATQLIRKIALSASTAIVKASDNGGGNKFSYGDRNSKAMNYSFSIGKLMLPKKYIDYRQTNLNLMIEFISQANLGSGEYYVDAAPVLQLIFNSQSRLDIGYKKQLTSTLTRTAPEGFVIRLEYNMFNIF
jgi:hypothetical protein